MMKAARLFFVICALLFAASATAQTSFNFQSPVLIADLKQIFLRSAFGLRMQQGRAAAWAALEAENARIEQELEEEELRLTQARSTLAQDVFSEQADAFDAKVRATRQQQREKAIAIQRQADEIPPEFIAAISPIMEGIMRETGAVVILDKRNATWHLNAIDVTDEAVLRIDSQIGEGLSLLEE